MTLRGRFGAFCSHPVKIAGRNFIGLSHDFTSGTTATNTLNDITRTVNREKDTVIVHLPPNQAIEAICEVAPRSGTSELRHDDAMSAGKQIVANDVDGVSDVVRNSETGCLIAACGSHETADSTLRLLGDDGLRNRCGARVRLDSDRFSAERMLEEIEFRHTQLATPAN